MMAVLAYFKSLLLNPHFAIRTIRYELFLLHAIAEFALTALSMYHIIGISEIIYKFIFGLSVIYFALICWFSNKWIKRVSRCNDRRNNFFLQMIQFIFSNNKRFRDIKRKLIVANLCLY